MKDLISLMDCFNDIFDDAFKQISTTKDYVLGHYSFSPSFTDFKFSNATYEIQTPNYPKSNYSVLEDGTSVIEIAVSGFDTDEITIKREDLKILVEGKKKEVKEETKKKKVIYKQIAERNFKLEYVGSPRWDYDKLIAKVSKGILTITIPVKEECKPINKTYEISK